MKKLGYEEGIDERLAGERRTLSQEVHRLKEQLDTLEARSDLFKYSTVDIYLLICL